MFNFYAAPLNENVRWWQLPVRNKQRKKLCRCSICRGKWLKQNNGCLNLAWKWTPRRLNGSFSPFLVWQWKNNNRELCSKIKANHFCSWGDFWQQFDLGQSNWQSNLDIKKHYASIENDAKKYFTWDELLKLSTLNVFSKFYYASQGSGFYQI